jgi:hypothetical protein
MTKNYITDMILEDDELVILVNDCYEYTVNKHRLTAFLKNENMMDWIYDTEKGGEHYQETGIYTFDEWYHSEYAASDVLYAIDKLDLKPTFIY